MEAMHAMISTIDSVSILLLSLLIIHFSFASLCVIARRNDEAIYETDVWIASLRSQ
jgi:hypothetical protein